jgi:hypothetical protein
MLRNTGVQEGFVRHKNYRRGPGKPPAFPWVHDAAGRAAKYMITSIELTRKFKAAGYSKTRLFYDFVRLCPEFPTYFHSHHGVTLTPEILDNRWHKAGAYSNGVPGRGGKPRRSAEHYTSSRWLRPIAEKCEAAFMARKPLSLDQMRELGALQKGRLTR